MPRMATMPDDADAMEAIPSNEINPREILDIILRHIEQAEQNQIRTTSTMTTTNDNIANRPLLLTSTQEVNDCYSTEEISATTRMDSHENENVNPMIIISADLQLVPTDPMLEIEIDSSSPPSSLILSSSSYNNNNSQEQLQQLQQQTTPTSSNKTTNNKSSSASNSKKSVLFDSVTVYHFTRSQGFSSIPSQGGSTLGMKRKHFSRRKLTVDLFEEVKRRSRREILLKIKLDKERCIDRRNKRRSREANNNNNNEGGRDDDEEQTQCNSVSSSTSTNTTTTSSSSDSDNDDDDDDDESFSDYSDISDSELEVDSYIFLQPVGVKLRRSLLRASGVNRIDPIEKKECKVIRESRERSGCKCVNQCIPSLCECARLGVNCHVDRISFPCGCISAGCQNPLGRTEFDIKRVKGHLYERLYLK